jgi:hypothetical protein
MRRTLFFLIPVLSVLFAAPQMIRPVVAEAATLPTTTVIAVGDIGAGDFDPNDERKEDNQVAALAKSQNPAFVLGLGDLNQGLGCEEAYRSKGGFEGAWASKGLKSKFGPVPGNHDWALPAPDSALDYDPNKPEVDPTDDGDLSPAEAASSPEDEAAPTAPDGGHDVAVPVDSAPESLQVDTKKKCSARPHGEGFFKYFADPAAPAGAPEGGAGRAGKGFWAKRVGDWTFISINTNCTPEGQATLNNHVTASPDCGRYSEQVNFLRATLDRRTTKCQAVLFHHPMFSSSAPFYTNVTDKTNPAYKYQQWIAKVTQVHGGDLFLSGHNHAYERTNPINVYTGKVDYTAGVRQFVLGTGGFSQFNYSKIVTGSAFRLSGVYGATRFKFTKIGWTSDFLGLNGRNYDHASAGCR